MERLVIPNKAGSLCYNDTDQGLKLEPNEITSHQRWLLLERLHEYEDTGLTPEQIMELKERDTAKAPIKPKTALDAYYHEPSCPNCGREFTPKICGYKMPQAIGYFDFCPWCGQRLKREDRT